MSISTIRIWDSDDGASTITANRLDDGIELISNDEETKGRVWFPLTAAPMLAGWLLAPFEGPTPFARATKGLRAVADALESVEAELRAALSYELIDNVRQHVENSLAVLRMGEKPHDVPVNTGSRLLLALGRLDRVHEWLSGIAPRLRVHQVDSALKVIEDETSDGINPKQVWPIYDLDEEVTMRGRRWRVVGITEDGGVMFKVLPEDRKET